MIWLIGGTSEAPVIACKLMELGYEMVATTTTLEGANLLHDCGVEVRVGGLSVEAMEELILAKEIRLVVDASHPYAALVSQNALEVCARLSLPYIRYERPELGLPDHPLIHKTTDMVGAAKLAFELGNTVLTTTGIKDLPTFVKERDKQRLSREVNLRLIAKVLPVVSSIQSCQDLGIEFKDIFAVGGTFSSKFYQELMREYVVDVMVTKESGEIGGVLEKLSACLTLGKPLIVVERPQLRYPEIVSNLTELAWRLGKVGVVNAN